MTNKNLTILAFSVFIIFLFSMEGWGAERQKLTIQEIYDLQERCNKSSSTFFKKMYGSGYDFAPAMTHHYDCHYNKKSNKCFIRIVTLLRKEGVTPGDDNDSNVSIELHDVQENKLIGLFSQSSEKCFFNGKDCKSINDWKYLANPFMEE